MVFLHFPSGYTDEEVMLKAKYAKLRKKKCALHAFQNPKSEPEKINSLKRPLEPKEAKEYAKKLLLSGKISVPTKGSGSKMIFKKSQGLLRKLSETRAAAVVAPTVNPDGGAFQSTSGVTGVSSGVQFKPFTPSTSSPSSSTDSSNTSSYSFHDRKFTPHGGKKRFNNNYNSPSSTGAGYSENQQGSSLLNSSGIGNSESPGNTGSGMSPFRNSPSGFHSSSDFHFRPKQGKTIHIRGFGVLTEEICREAFNNIGSIINVSMELDRNCGFVTFDKIESAEKAIHEINGTFVGGTKLQVSFARRQPPVSEIIGEAAGIAWATIAANPSHKSTFKDKRDAVVYDDDLV